MRGEGRLQRRVAEEDEVERRGGDAAPGMRVSVSRPGIEPGTEPSTEQPVSDKGWPLSWEQTWSHN